MADETAFKKPSPAETQSTGRLTRRRLIIGGLTLTGLGIVTGALNRLRIGLAPPTSPPTPTAEPKMEPTPKPKEMKSILEKVTDEEAETLSSITHQVINGSLVKTEINLFVPGVDRFRTVPSLKDWLAEGKKYVANEAVSVDNPTGFATFKVKANKALKVDSINGRFNNQQLKSVEIGGFLPDTNGKSIEDISDYLDYPDDLFNIRHLNPGQESIMQSQDFKKFYPHAKEYWAPVMVANQWVGRLYFNNLGYFTISFKLS